MAQGEAAVRAAFRYQAEACRTMGSPFTALVSSLVAERIDRSGAVGCRLLDWPGDPSADALPLRLAGALHALALTGADAGVVAAWPPNTVDREAIWRAMTGAFVRHEARILATLESPPQTNETARSGLLLPALLVVARETGLPLSLFEIGSSAGLNLSPDKFAYAYGDARHGGPSGVTLAPSLRGAVPDLSGTLAIARRRGIDQAPVEIADTAARTRLLSYVWPDQSERLARCRAAIEIALDGGVRVERADAAEAVEALLANPVSGVATVVFHTIVWQYLAEPTKARVASALADAGTRATAAAPLAWLRFEGVGPSGGPPAQVRLTLWPEGRTRILAEGDFHGRWLDWYETSLDV
jgi:hypothetical protein